jgi:preprotein translocase subunit YajC
MSQSGLIGELVEIDERFAKVKIAPGTTVKMVATTVSALEASAEKSDDKLKDLKDAKAATEKK